MEGLTATNADELLDSRDLLALGAMADDVRRRLHGARTTFVRVFEVHVDAPPASLPQTLTAGELRIVGTPSSIDHAASVVAAVAGLAGNVPVTGFSLTHVQSFGQPLREIARTLSSAGLYALSEVTLDTVVDPEHVTELRAGGLMVHRLTIHSYRSEPPALVLQRAAGLQRTAGGFKSFAPLPRVLNHDSPTTGYDDAKRVSVARLVVADVPSIQVDWALYGPKLAQVALTMGADDIDSVAAFDPAALGARRTAIAEVTGNIRAAALEPAERTARFDLGGS